MNPIFDPHFSESSCGFRLGRSAHDGVKQIKQYIRQGYKIAVDMDLSKFFDTVNHDVLMHRVSRRIEDKRVLKLIGKYLRAGVMVGKWPTSCNSAWSSARRSTFTTSCKHPP